MRIDKQRAAVSGIFAVHGAVMGTFAARIPALSAHLGLSSGQLGLALFMPGMGILLTMPFAGRLVHRLGNRRAIQLLVGAWGASLILPAWAPNLWTLCAGLLVYGATAGLSDVSMNTQGVAVETAAGKPIMPSLHGLWSLGGFVASGVGAAVTALDVSYRVHLTVTGIVLAVAAPLIGAVITPAVAAPEAPSAEKVPGQTADVPGDTSGAETAASPPRFSLPTGTVLLLGLIGFCSTFAEGSATNWSAVYVSKVTHGSPAVAAAGYAVFACVMSAMRLFGGGIVRRAGPVRVLRVGGVVSAAGGVLIVVARIPALAFAGIALLAVGVALVIPLLFAAAGRTGPNPGQAIAGTSMIAYSADLIAPGVVGGIAQAASLPVAFLLITVLAAAITPGAGLVRAAALPEPAQRAEAVSEAVVTD
ncbi:MAG TPA: MFS transporter [Actinocrinis sp.]